MVLIARFQYFVYHPSAAINAAMRLGMLSTKLSIISGPRSAQTQRWQCTGSDWIWAVWAMDRCVPVLRSMPERDFLISPSTGPEGSGVTGETGMETHRNY